MKYTLQVRAFIQTKRKDKAIAHATRLFPGLPFKVVGKYWKDDSQWKVRVAHDCEYADDKTALWEVLAYFRQVLPQWLIIVGPNEAPYELLISAVGTNDIGTALTWCSFEVWRGHGHPSTVDESA